jgi:hypothetical protein
MSSSIFRFLICTVYGFHIDPLAAGIAKLKEVTRRNKRQIWGLSSLKSKGLAKISRRRHCFALYAHPARG